MSSIGWISSNELVSSSWDQTIKLWNMDTLQSTQTFVRFHFNRNFVNYRKMILHRFRNVEKLFYLLTYHQSMVYYFVVLLIDLFVFMIHVFKVCFLFNQIKSNLFCVICRRICSSINIFLS